MTVTAIEGRLLRSVRAVLQPASLPELRVAVVPTVAGKTEPTTRYARIGPEAMRLLMDSIRVGTVHALVRHGGWQRRPLRLWDAVPDLSLRFSAEAFHVCRWLCGDPVALQPRTLGDELLFRLVADAVARCELDVAPLSGSLLVCLAHAERLDLTQLDWTRLLVPDGIAILHGLHDDHAQRWARMEQGELEDPRDHTLASRRRHVVLESFLDAIDRVGRRDLAGFMIDAGAQLAGRPAVAWVAGLSANASLMARTEAARAAATLLRSFARLARWHEQLATVPFFEPEYDRAQIIVRQWEHLGRAGLAALSRVADELESGRPLIGEGS